MHSHDIRNTLHAGKKINKRSRIKATLRSLQLLSCRCPKSTKLRQFFNKNDRDHKDMKQSVGQRETAIRLKGEG